MRWLFLHASILIPLAYFLITYLIIILISGSC